MAERKAVNKYYPPEWTPSQGSINKFRGTHALRERARKLHMGILIIRFEMPFNIWCNGCENHIGMGVRYNAEKTKVGMYYSTPIYKFRMKCHLCTNHFEIQTDPQNLDYVILDGARRQERRWDPTQNEQVVPEDKDVSKKLALDSMYRLEHGVEDKGKQKSILPSLAQLEDYKERWKDDYLLNKDLRNQFRAQKKDLAASEERDSVLLKKSSLNLSLLPETSEDKRLASLLKLAPTKSFDEQQKLKREKLLSRPLFPTSDKKLGFIQQIRETKVKALLKSLSKNELGITKKAPKEISKDTTSISSCSTNEETNTTAISNSKSFKTTVKISDEITMDKNTELKITSGEISNDKNSDLKLISGEISSDKNEDLKMTSSDKNNSLVAFDYDSSSDDEICKD